MLHQINILCHNLLILSLIYKNNKKIYTKFIYEYA